MFTWICPKCGTEVPPSYNDCPNCEAREKAAAAAPAPVAAPVPPAPVITVAAPAPVSAPAPAPVVVAPVSQPPLVGTPPTETALPTFSYGGAPLPASAPSDYGPPPSSGMPSWLIAVLSILGVAAVGYGVIHFMRDKNGVAAESTEVVETARPSGEASPLAKFVEVVGFRIVENKQKVELKFVIVNHSPGELAPFDLDVRVRTKAQKPDEAPIFTVKTPVKGLLPFEAKDLSIPVKTTLRAYEMPDWQFLTATFDIIQP
jgi:hypothetical protein